MNDRLSILFSGLSLGQDGIWSGTNALSDGAQNVEREFRESVASPYHADYLSDIARNHSVPVMDREVMRFLESMPPSAVILDVGGCWGWHWRSLQKSRPDVTVIIVDFVRANLHSAKAVLGPLVGTQVALVHADATSLPFSSDSFDGFWTVQAFQHIPDFRRACSEAHRVLKSGGRFANYSLHITPLVRLVYRLFGKPYHIAGSVQGAFHLARADQAQQDDLAAIFMGKVRSRYTEQLFHPDLKFTRSGHAGSLLGRLDAVLGSIPHPFGWLLARQRSFEVVKRA